MDEVIKFLTSIGQYLLANPVWLGAVAGSLGLFILAIIVLSAKASKGRKARKAAKLAAAQAAVEEPVAEETVEPVVEETAIAEEPVVEEEPVPVAEEPVKEEKPKKEKKAKAKKAVKEEPVVEETPVEEEPAPVAEEPVKEEKPKKEKKAKAKKAVKEEPVVEETPVQEEPAPVTEEPVKEEKLKKEKKAKAKKAVKEEPIVEEAPVQEEPAPVAEEPVKEEKQSRRYSGKWVVYKVIFDGAQDEEETYFFELQASNGEKLLSSEEYSTLVGALKGIETHKANILRNNFRITTSKKGDFIFKLLSGKNTLLCTGENYPTQVRCEKAVESTKRFAETAYVEESVRELHVTVPTDDGAEEPAVEYDDSLVGKWIVESKKSPAGEDIFYFELFASNGEKLLSSEEYTSFTGAINGINTHKTNIEKGNFRIALTKRGDFIYKLLSSNGQLLCLGEHYKTKKRCESAVESVKRFAKISPVLTDSENKE